MSVGVREVDETAFARIVKAGHTEAALSSDLTRPVVEANFASPATAMAVDAVAMDLAVAEAERRFPSETVERMPHNNPGFDLRITSAPEPPRCVEVKGTQRREPRFLMSDGEYRFSARHADRYSLWVFCSLDLTARTATLVEREGTVVDGPGLTLAPAVWFGVLRSDESAS